MIYIVVTQMCVCYYTSVGYSSPWKEEEGRDAEINTEYEESTASFLASGLSGLWSCHVFIMCLCGFDVDSMMILICTGYVCW